MPVAIARGAGGFAAFARRTVVSSPSAFVYLGETVRQVGILVTGSALLIWFMTFVIGTMCGIEAVYSLRGFGATAFSGGFTALCGTREMAPYMFAYIISAKIGCGLVAELGAMRINEEIDALATTGIDPYRFLIAPRFVAALLALPLLFLVGLAFTNLGHFMTVVVQVGEVSQGVVGTDPLGGPEPADDRLRDAQGVVDGVSDHPRRALLRLHGQRRASWRW